MASIRRRQVRLSALASLLPVVLLLGCSTTTGGGSAGGSAGDTAGVTAGEVHLGMSNALTGPVAAVCLPASQGAQAWVDKVNSGGGVNGRKLVIDVLDDGSDAPRAAANVRALTNRGIFAMFGGCGTVSAAAISTALHGTDVPYLFPYAALPDLVEPPQSNVFSILPLYRDQAYTAISHVVGARPGGVYAITSQIPGFESTVNGVKAGTSAAGAPLISSELLPATNAPVEQAAAKAGQQPMDYLAMTVLAPDAARLLNALAGSGHLPSKAVVGSSPLAAQSFAAAVAPTVAPLLRTLSPTVPPADPRAQDCVRALAQYSPGTNPDALALFGCAAAQVLVNAINRTGQGLTRAGLVKALEGLQNEQVSSLLPPLSFSPGKHVGLNSMFLLNLDGARHYQVADTVPLETAP